jgi:hypothetical protein
MQAATRAENEELKAFISRQNDKYRPAYGRRVEDHPRQCIFAATTNDRIFLKDRTGGRRFWIVMCDGKPEKELKEFTSEVAEQCWAELMEIWKKDKDLLPSQKTLDAAREMQEEHTEGSEKFGLIQDYLDTKLPERWKAMTLQERRDWLSGETSIEGEGVLERDRVCAMEVWCECFGYNPEKIRNLDAREINTILQHMPGWKPYDRAGGRMKFSRYGQQRAYCKVSYGREQNEGDNLGDSSFDSGDSFLDDLM